MAEERRIKTPWRVQWLRIRSQLLPVVTLLCCVALTVWLWSRHVGGGNAVGAVEVVRAAVTSDADGVLASFQRDKGKKPIEVFAKVEEGEQVARLDTTLLEAQRRARVSEMQQLTRQLKEARTRKAPADEIQDLETAIEGREADITEIDLKLQGAVIRSPVKGTITRVLRRPGQIVRVGEPIFDIVADTGPFIVSFIRQDQRIHPHTQMEVEVRPVSAPGRSFAGRVDEVGGFIEQVPSEQLRDPRTPEWGLPVRVVAPLEANLKPGEMVNLVFKSAPPAGT